MRDDVKPFDDCVDEGDLPRIERVRTRAWHYRYCWGKLMKIEDDVSPEWTEIHVPKGSIVSDFVLDLN